MGELYSAQGQFSTLCWYSIYSLVQNIHWHGTFGIVPISYPALLFKAWFFIIGDCFRVDLLPSLRAMVIEVLGAFSYLVKKLKCLFGYFYDFLVILYHILLKSDGWHPWVIHTSLLSL